MLAWLEDVVVDKLLLGAPEGMLKAHVSYQGSAPKKQVEQQEEMLTAGEARLSYAAHRALSYSPGHALLA